MITVDIPGGQATLFNSMEEMTPRRRRPIEIVSSRLGRRLAAVQGATRLFCDGDLIADQSEAKKPDGTPAYTGGDVTISEHELGLLLRLNDVSAFALLKSWTIPHPLPTSEVEFTEIPTDVYEVLVVEAAKLTVAMLLNTEAAPS